MAYSFNLCKTIYESYEAESSESASEFSPSSAINELEKLLDFGAPLVKPFILELEKLHLPDMVYL